MPKKVTEGGDSLGELNTVMMISARRRPNDRSLPLCLEAPEPTRKDIALSDLGKDWR